MLIKKQHKPTSHQRKPFKTCANHKPNTLFHYQFIWFYKYVAIDYSVLQKEQKKNAAHCSVLFSMLYTNNCTIALDLNTNPKFRSIRYLYLNCPMYKMLIEAKIDWIYHLLNGHGLAIPISYNRIFSIVFIKHWKAIENNTISLLNALKYPLFKLKWMPFCFFFYFVFLVQCNDFVRFYFWNK